jgi:hypothetical protein
MAQKIPSATKQAAEKVARETKGVPQRLKPRCSESSYGATEVAPLQNNEFFRSL